MLDVIFYPAFDLDVHLFWPTFLLEIVVIAFAVRAFRRDPGGLAFGRRLTILEPPSAWSLPFYLWAWQANHLVSALFVDPNDPALTTRFRDRTVSTVFISLFYLLALRTVGTTLTKSAPATLGLLGYSRTAVTAALLSVFLNVALLYWFLQVVGRTAYGLRYD